MFALAIVGGIVLVVVVAFVVAWVIDAPNPLDHMDVERL